MFNIEGLEVFLTVLALISAAVSVYSWHRAPAITSLPDQPSFTLEWLARCHTRPVQPQPSPFSFLLS